MVAIVLLPGMDGTGVMFAGLASALKEEYRTIIVSYPENEPLGYRELEAYARAVLPTDEPYILLGGVVFWAYRYFIGRFKASWLKRIDSLLYVRPQSFALA